MQVSVVVCTHAEDRYEHFVAAAESVLSQTYDPVELILVVDGNETVFERVQADFGDRKMVCVHHNETNRGVSASRTTGAELATGEVVAFIDDDAVAEPDWIEELVAAYESTDALAVGGRMNGDWLAGRPWFLPPEFDWLVGVTYPGFAEPGEEVRNTFESNLSFRREVFLDLGGFDPDLGPTATDYSHSEGAELGTRLRAEYGRGVVYAPDAVVRHKVFEYRTTLRWLLSRAFEQGTSKRSLERRTAASTSEEFGYLRTLLFVHVPRRLWALVRAPSGAALSQFLMLFVFTGVVGLGYLSAVAGGALRR